MTIRKASASDYDQVWTIFARVIATGDTYVFDPSTPKSDLKKLWFADSMTTFVAEENDEIIGSYFIKPNQLDLGSHVANCGYMVSPEARGKGIGGRLCEHSLRFAKESGYLSMQFNIVVSTNTAAVALWKKHGFRILGTTPKGFRRPDGVLLDTHIMYREL